MSYKEFYQAVSENTLKPLYVFYGPEILLIDRMLEQAREKCLSSLTVEFNYAIVESDNITFEQSFGMVEMLPVMDNRRIVVFKNPLFIQKELWDESSLKSFLQFHSVADCTTTTILWVPTIDKRKKIFKEISKIGDVISFDALDEGDLNKWLRQEVKKGGKILSAAVATHLIERSGYYHQDTEVDLYCMLGWLQTLLHQTSDVEILKKDVDHILKFSVEANVFKLVDAVFEGQKTVAQQQIQALIASGEAELKLLFMLQRHVRQLLKVKQLHQEGFSQATISEMLSLKSFVVKKSLGHCNRLSLAQLREILFLTERTDGYMKSSATPVTTLLEWVVVKIMLLK